MAELQEFIDACNDQEVQLHPNIVGCAASGRLDMGFQYRCFVPDDRMAAVAAAGRIVRKNPEESLVVQYPENSLAIQPITFETEDLALRALRDIINSSTQPIERRHPFGISCRGSLAIPGCGDIETFFCSTFSYAMGGKTTGVKYPGFDAVVDEDGLAFIRTPNPSSRSSMAMRPFHINGIPYPAGSLVRLEMRQDAYSSALLDRPLNPMPSYREPRVLLQDDIVRAGFVRLTAFAFLPEARDLFLKTSFGTYLSEPYTRDAKQVRYMPLEHIGAIITERIANIPPSR